MKKRVCLVTRHSKKTFRQQVYVGGCDASQKKNIMSASLLQLSCGTKGRRKIKARKRGRLRSIRWAGLRCESRAGRSGRRAKRRTGECVAAHCQVSAHHGHAQVGHGPPYIATHERREQHSLLGFTVTIHIIFYGRDFRTATQCLVNRKTIVGCERRVRANKGATSLIVLNQEEFS